MEVAIMSAVSSPDEIDWPALRKDLAKRRKAHPEFGRNKSAFARACQAFSRSGRFERVTIMRLENVEGLPDYRPELDTMAAWLRALGSKEKISAFVGQHELADAPDKTENRRFHAEGEHGAADRTVPDITDADRQLLGSFAFALLRAIGHPLAPFEMDDTQEKRPHLRRQNS